MPYQVQQLIDGRGKPVCIHEDDPVSKAFALMIENDFSQLPVVRKHEWDDIPEGMVTYEGILRGIVNFKAKIEDLKVRGVMVSAPIYTADDDLFDILNRLKDTNAVLIVDSNGENLVGIVTSYDTTEYFRNRTEDLMRVEDIEYMIKEFIKAAYTNKNGELDEAKLNERIADLYTSRNRNERSEVPSFEDLVLGEYISLLFMKEPWAYLDPIFKMQKSHVSELLHGVRRIRNVLMHFRGDISAEDRDKLKFCMDWLTRCQDEYQTRKEKEYAEEMRKAAEKNHKPDITPAEIAWASRLDNIISSNNYSTSDSSAAGGRYAPLADWLQSQSGRFDQASLTFNQIEEIIGGDLPPSARTHRAWWANDMMGHSQSKQWLEAGWRTTFINLTEGRVSFSRIKEKEKAYITFYGKLLNELKNRADFPIKDVSPYGTNWMVIQTIAPKGKTCGSYAFNFTRDKRFRVELYLDLQDQALTKEVFDKLYKKRDIFEAKTGPLVWERLDNRRASRIGIYHDGTILDEKKHVELINWAIKNMSNLYDAFNEPITMVLDE